MWGWTLAVWMLLQCFYQLWCLNLDTFDHFSVASFVMMIPLNIHTRKIQCPGKLSELLEYWLQQLLWVFKNELLMIQCIILSLSCYRGNSFSWFVYMWCQNDVMKWRTMWCNGTSRLSDRRQDLTNAALGRVLCVNSEHVFSPLCFSHRPVECSSQWCFGVVRGAGRHGSVACGVTQHAQPGAFRFVFTFLYFRCSFDVF